MLAGIKYKDFMHSTMVAVLAEINGFEKRTEIERDKMLYSAWLFGQYTMCAIQSTIGNSQWFKNKHVKPFEYPDNPLVSKNETEELTEEEKIKYTEMYFTQLSLLATNFELSKQKENNEINEEGATNVGEE